MRKGTCKYRTPGFNTHCSAGVEYRSVTKNPDQPGSWFRSACVRDWSFLRRPHLPVDTENQGTCSKYCEPTDEELAAYKADVDAMLNSMTKVFPAISKVKETHRNKNWSGIIPCPVCGGNLHLSHAACNGHVHGRCETKNCVSWME